MIWEFQSKVIVMLCETQEEGKVGGWVWFHHHDYCMTSFRSLAIGIGGPGDGVGQASGDAAIGDGWEGICGEEARDQGMDNTSCTCDSTQVYLGRWYPRLCGHSVPL